MEFTVHTKMFNKDHRKELNRNLTAFINRFDFEASYSIDNGSVTVTFAESVPGAQDRCCKITGRLEQKYAEAKK